MQTLRLGAVALDCADANELATFWSEFLDAPIVFVNERFAALNTGAVWLTMHQVLDYQPPSWPSAEVPKQMHLDVAAPDLDAAESRALTLGAQKTQLQPSPERWRVLIDPAGHPFCVSNQVPD